MSRLRSTEKDVDFPLNWTQVPPYFELPMPTKTESLGDFITFGKNK